MQPDILPSCLPAMSSNLQYVAVKNELKRPDWLLTTTTGVWVGLQYCVSTPNNLMHTCGRMFTLRILFSWLVISGLNENAATILIYVHPENRC